MEHLKLTTSTPNIQIRKAFDKILSECLPNLNPRSIKVFEISCSTYDPDMPLQGKKLISDKVAQHFFSEILRYQRELKHISLANANLSDNAMISLI